MTFAPLEIAERHLGGLDARCIEAAKVDTIDSLAKELAAYYASWQPPQNTELRLYSGGWIAGNLALADSFQYLLNSLVYYPQVVIHDPIADLFYPGAKSLSVPPTVRARVNNVEFQGSEGGLLQGYVYQPSDDGVDRAKRQLKWAIPALEGVLPLIDDAVVPVPQWWIVERRQQEILAALRHDVRDPKLVEAVRADSTVLPRGDRVRGLGVRPHGGWRSSDEARGDSQDHLYFLAKTLAIQADALALYVPPTEADARLLNAKLDDVGRELRRRNIELRLAPALTSAQLPWVGDLRVADIVAIRKGSAAFEEWRRELRVVARAIGEGDPSDSKFFTSAREALEDHLLPRVHEVERDTAGRTLLGGVRSTTADLTVGAGTVLTSAVLLHAPLTIAALAGVGLSSVARWAISPLLRGAPQGGASILATLVKR